MALEAEQGRSETAISHGEPSGRLSRGFPSGETRGRAFTRGSISVNERVSGGTETSKYPEERKSTETPLVAASEKGIAQTGCD